MFSIFKTTKLYQVCHPNDIEKFKSVLSKSKPDIVYEYEPTTQLYPIFLCIKYNNITGVKLLLEKNNTKEHLRKLIYETRVSNNIEHYTPLIYACILNRLEIVKIILSYDNSIEYIGATATNYLQNFDALYFSLISEQIDEQIPLLLLQYIQPYSHFKIKYTEYYQHTSINPLFLACYYNKPLVAKKIIDYDINRYYDIRNIDAKYIDIYYNNTTILIQACKYKMVFLVEFLLKIFTDQYLKTKPEFILNPFFLEYTDKDGNTALIYCCKYPILDSYIELLLSINNTGRHIQIQNNDGINALMYCIENNNLEGVLNLLLISNSKEYINTPDSLGSTTLMYCAKTSNYQIMEILLSIDNSSTFIRKQDLNGFTALMYCKDIECIKLLLQNDPTSAHISIQNNLYQTVSDIFSNNNEILQLFTNVMSKDPPSKTINTTNNLTQFYSYLGNFDTTIIKNILNDDDVLSKIKKLDIFNAPTKIKHIKRIKLQDNRKSNLDYIIQLINANKGFYISSLVMASHTVFGGGPLKEFFFSIQQELKLIGSYRLLKKKRKDTNQPDMLKIIDNDLQIIRKQAVNIPIQLLENGIETQLFWNIIHLSDINVFNYNGENVSNDTAIIIDNEILYSLKKIPHDLFIYTDPNLLKKFCYFLLINGIKCFKDDNKIGIHLLNLFLDRNSSSDNTLAKYERQLKEINPSNVNSVQLMQNAIKQYQNSYSDHELLHSDNPSTNFFNDCIVSTDCDMRLREITKLIYYNFEINPLTIDAQGASYIISKLQESVETRNISNQSIKDLYIRFINSLQLLFQKDYNIVAEYLKLITGNANKPDKLTIIIADLNNAYNADNVSYAIHTCFNSIDIDILMFFDTTNFDTKKLKTLSQDIKSDLIKYYYYIIDTLKLKPLTELQLAQKIGLVLFYNDYFTTTTMSGGGSNKQNNYYYIILVLILIVVLLILKFCVIKKI